MLLCKNDISLIYFHIQILNLAIDLKNKIKATPSPYNHRY